MALLNQVLVRIVFLILCLLAGTTWSQDTGQTALLEQAKKAVRSRDFPQAEVLLLQLANQNHPQGQYMLATLYLRPNGRHSDRSKGVTYLIQAAQSAYPQAQFDLARLFERGKGVEKDLDKAAYWYGEAAKNGLSKAQSKLQLLLSQTRDSVTNQGQAKVLVFEAVKRGDLSTVERLFTHFDLNNIVSKTGHTILNVAIESQRARIVQYLLQQGVRPNFTGNADIYPVIQAVDSGQLSILTLLLDYGAQTNVQDSEGNSPLIYAVRANNLPMVKSLLASGANPNHQNTTKLTPMDFAKNSPSIAAELIKSGARNVTTYRDEDVLKANLTALSQEDSSNNPYYRWPALNIAAWRGETDLVGLLLAEHFAPDSLGPSGYSPMMRAAMQGHFDIVQQLISHGAKTDLTLPDGRTALYLAIQAQKNQTALLLLEKSQVVRQPDKPYVSPLVLATQLAMEALSEGMLELDPSALHRDGQMVIGISASLGLNSLLQRLISQKVNVDSVNERNQTPLLLAALSTQLRSSEILLSSQANPNIQDIDGNTALMIAVSKGALELTNLLLNHNANTALTNGNQNTALMLAAQQGQPDILKLLLDAGSELESRNEASLTALMIAARQGHMECVKLLVEHGADVTRRDKNGRTSGEIARQKGHQKVADWLMSRAKSNGLLDIFS